MSNDNPFSEAAFKTLKYCPAFPDHFGSIEDPRALCVQFFNYHHHDHYHSGLGLHTPASVHFGMAEQIREGRAETLTDAYARHPERFSRRPRTHSSCPPQRGSTHATRPPDYRRPEDSVSKKILTGSGAVPRIPGAAGLDRADARLVAAQHRVRSPLRRALDRHLRWHVDSVRSGLHGRDRTSSVDAPVTALARTATERLLLADSDGDLALLSVPGGPVAADADAITTFLDATEPVYADGDLGSSSN
ncbi:hypothetical protein Raf01_93610 [Rugosimonospora africana]|uniref:Transposase n=1 Tax=Rugosimonospora africana TaxID=556532 RepID=A0A8J3VWR9_9ACTN|nr:hypothetical protein Raf01_93610 [Rugosimonospora africana]